MEARSLTEIDILNGSFALSFVVFSIVIGLRFIFKYKEYKKIELITAGITWIFLSSVLWGAAFAFLVVMVFNIIIDDFTYILIATAFVPGALLCWIFTITTMVYPKTRIKIFMPFLCLCIIYEIFLILALFTDPSIIATREGIIYMDANLFNSVFNLIAILSALITGFIFTKKSLKSDDPKIRWKGKFLTIAFIVFSVGAFLDGNLPADAIFSVFTRSLMIISSFLYYLGFFLPAKLAEILIKVK